jgi:hypothetical protein
LAFTSEAATPRGASLATGLGTSLAGADVTVNSAFATAGCDATNWSPLPERMLELDSASRAGDDPAVSRSAGLPVALEAITPASVTGRRAIANGR